MKLSQASVYFDRTQAFHPDSGAPLFKGQIDPFDDAKRDAATAYRRILSVAKGIVPPPAVRMLDVVYLVGSLEVDGHANVHRWKYVLHPVVRTLGVGSIANFLPNAGLPQVWAGVDWFKDVKQIDVNSLQPAIYSLTFPRDRVINAQDVVQDLGASYLVLEAHENAGGFVNAIGLRLEQRLPQTATLTTQIYNATTGRYTPGSNASAPALQVRWLSLFGYGSAADAKYEPGDQTIVLPSGTAVTTSTKIALGGRNWKVVTIDPLANAVAVHARPAP